MKNEIIKNIAIVLLFSIVFISISSIVVYSYSNNYKPKKPSSALIDIEDKSTITSPLKSTTKQLISLSIIILITSILYFIPTAISLIKKHTYKIYIIGINILLGWTLIGWILCLVWSLIDDKESI